MANDLTTEVLDALDQSDGPVFTAKAFPSVPFVTIKSALDRLASREMIVYNTIEQEEAILTEEGQGIASHGSHEAKVYEAVRAAMKGLKVSELSVCGPKCTPAGLESM
jgi:phenylalanyl-tRNA synthetase alpha chain